MRSPLLLVLALAPFYAVGCVDVDGDCGGTIEITTNMSYSEEYGVMIPESCSVTNPDGSIDYSDCCPEGYTFVYGVGTGVICEQDCSLGSDATVLKVQQSAFVAHALATATVSAFDALPNGSAPVPNAQ